MGCGHCKSPAIDIALVERVERPTVEPKIVARRSVIVGGNSPREVQEDLSSRGAVNRFDGGHSLVGSYSGYVNVENVSGSTVKSVTLAYRNWQDTWQAPIVVVDRLNNGRKKSYDLKPRKIRIQEYQLKWQTGNEYTKYIPIVEWPLYFLFGVTLRILGKGDKFEFEEYWKRIDWP